MEEPILEFRPPRGAITQPLKKLKINVFKVHKCAVCGFTTENLLQFHEHIPQHKSDGSSYQCRECGLCYTSHVSLSRHLFIVHKLKEPQPVSKQNGSGEDNQQENKPNHEDESSDSTASDRRCKVCAKTFETEAALNTHMRTHGMAFIKSKRMSSAEKWSDYLWCRNLSPHWNTDDIFATESSRYNSVNSTVQAVAIYSA